MPDLAGLYQRASGIHHATQTWRQREAESVEYCNRRSETATDCCDGLAMASQGTAREFAHADECRARSGADDGLGAHYSAVYRQTQLSDGGCGPTVGGREQVP